MTLTDDDYKQLAILINNIGDSGTVEYEKDNEVLSFDYYVDADVIHDDDYFNGTGETIVTRLELSISNEKLYNQDTEIEEEYFIDPYLIREYLY